MKIKIAYYGQARQIAGLESETIEAGTEDSLQDIISGRIAVHNELSRLLSSPNGSLRQSVMISVNDDAVDTEHHVQVKDGDTVSIFPAIAGG